MYSGFKAFRKFKLAHKYAINSRYLGDIRPLAWSNLGYWEEGQFDQEAAKFSRPILSYVQACAQLADRLAQDIQLKSNDILFDLGCGQGASLLHWQQHYAVEQIYAVELQSGCLQVIQQHLQPCPALYPYSFYHLQQHTFPQQADAVLCIDAAYHGKLSEFLNSVTSIMHQGSRLGFHCLIWSQQATQMTWRQRQFYRYLLKAADIEMTHLLDAEACEYELKQHDFEQIRITRLSTAVLKGFADYIDQHLASMNTTQSHRPNIDIFKIKMTAKLCRRLYEDGLVDYVQVSAVYGK